MKLGKNTLIITAAALLALVGCSGGSDQKENSSDTASTGTSVENDKSGAEVTGTVVWSTWGNPEELTRFEEFNKKFMEKYPGIKVTLQAVPSYSDYHAKLLAQLTSNTAPDLFYIGDDKIGQFVASDKLMAVDEVLDNADSAAKRADFNADLFGAAQKDGKTYAGPNDVNPDALWYDKQALKDAGITEDPAELAANGKWTTEKFLEMNDKLKKAGKTGTMFWNYWNTHYSWISSQGGKAYDGDKFVANTDPATLEAVKILGEKFQDKTFVVADSLPEGAGADSIFVTHKAGFFAQGRYTIGTLKGAEVQDMYDIVDWPSKDGSAPSTGVATSYLAINAETKSPEAAKLFWQEFLSVDGQKIRLSGGGNAVPSIKGADDIVTAEGYPAHAKTFIDMRDRGWVNYASEARVPGLSGDISNKFLELYEGKIDAQTCLDQVAELVKKAK